MLLDVLLEKDEIQTIIKKVGKWDSVIPSSLSPSFIAERMTEYDYTMLDINFCPDHEFCMLATFKP